MGNLPINIEEIQSFLTHRYPILLVDRVIDYQKGDYAIGLKNVTFNEPHFQGHFPGHSVMPGVLIIKALASRLLVISPGARRIIPRCLCLPPVIKFACTCRRSPCPSTLVTPATKVATQRIWGALPAEPVSLHRPNALKQGTSTLIAFSLALWP